MADGTPADIYEAVIADLESRIAAMQAIVENLRGIQAGSGLSLAGLGAPAKPKQSAAEFTHDAFFGMTVAEATRKYLSAIRKTASVPTITEVLLAGGLKSASKNVPENIRTILSRHADFVKINGEFGLAEWYPGRKTYKGKVQAPAVPQSGIVEEEEEATSLDPAIVFGRQP